jgi:hypothetical protein
MSVMVAVLPRRLALWATAHQVKTLGDEAGGSAVD